MQVYPTTVSPTLRLVRDEDAPTYDGEPIKRPPFTMIDTESHDYVAANMGSHTYSVFAYLCRRINAKTGECHPSVATIAESTAMSARQVRYSLAELEQAGFVTRETRTNAVGLTLGMAYRVTVSLGPARGQVVQPIENGAARKRNARGTDAERTVAGGAAKLYVEQDVELEEPNGSLAAPTKSRRKGAETDMPKDFAPTPEGVTWAKEKYGYSDADLADRLDRMQTYVAQHGKRYVNWQAAWKTFMRPKEWEAPSLTKPGETVEDQQRRRFMESLGV